ncbi:hypothetical protein FOA52_003824 [Chlamydomonas sp. UWO 241]|nr:hypothetical protein FOA52_003824 [Chlamydomonas sp. UWO 241]
MLTTDVANLHDASYRNFTKLYAANITELNTAFAHAWYKLTTQDMGPAERCLGNMVPAPQPFQHPLPRPGKAVAKLENVRAAIVKALRNASLSDILEPDTLPDGSPWYGALFVNLAYQCALTFRATDYRGGCSGARIRLLPQREWPNNAGMDKVLAVVQTMKDQFKDNELSWADLIVLAAQVALEEAGMPQVLFCGGRSDAIETDDDGGVHVRDWYPDPFVAFRDNMRVMGLNEHEAIALMGRLRSPTQQARLNYTGSYTNESATLSNNFYNYLLTEDWQGWVSKNESTGMWQYNNEGTSGNMVMSGDDLVILYNTTWRAVAQEFAADDAKFKSTFASAWSKLMNADRFKGPAGNLCGDGISGVVTEPSINSVVAG